MARYYYNSAGNLRGVNYSSKERGQQNAYAMYFYLLCVVAAPFYPLYLISTYIYELLAGRLGLHALFSGTLALVVFGAGLYGLWVSRVFRCAYFGVTTVAVSMVVFQGVLANGDAVWATFFSMLTLVGGVAFTYLVDLLDRTYRPVSVQHTVVGHVELASRDEHSAPRVADTGDEASLALSYPVSDVEAALLISKVSDAGWDLLEAMSACATGPGFASIAWKEAKAITKHRNWPEFVETTLAGLHGLLREVTGDPQAKLIIDSDQFYFRGQRPPGGRSLIIQGPAVEALQRGFAQTYPR